MKVRIDIDTRTFVRFWLVVIGFAFAILAIYSARHALILLGTAFFLALALNAPVSYLAKHLPGKSRAGGTAIAFVVVIIILGALLFLVIPPIVEQTVKVAQTVPSLVDGATTQWHGLAGLIDKYHLQDQVNNAVESIKSNTTHWATDASRHVVSGVGSVLSFVVQTVLVLVLSFLMLVEGPIWMQRIWGIYNDEKRMEHHRAVVRRMYGVVTGYVTGQLTVSALDGIFAGMAVFIISLFFKGVPADLALPAMAILFTLSLIPMFGATIGGVLIALLLAFNNLGAGIVFAIYFVVYQQVENNFISPAIQSRKVELSALAVLAAVTIGLYVFGLAGGIISIPIAGCIKVLLEEYLKHAKQNRVKSERPVTKLVKKLKGETE